MRVVLFCGGLGMRLRDYSDTMPKPMVQIGYRPLIWWVMKYYAHFGHRDFILCLGYKGDIIKDYFLNYNECRSNDFVLSQGGQRVELLQKDIEDWRITFVDTGLHANIGERLMAVRSFLRDEDVFLANYSDGLTDFPLPTMIGDFLCSDNVATFLSVRPTSTFHFVSRREDGRVTAIDDVKSADAWINGGFFVLRRSIFDYMEAGDELVVEPFQRLITEGKLSTHAYEGFWRCVDTFKDLQALEALHAKGRPPWELWRREPVAVPARPALAAARPAAQEPAGPWQVRSGS
ncbi:MAG TPA: sugar phosphate nucleotidyltransferase [Stellaceae bacterium]